MRDSITPTQIGMWSVSLEDHGLAAVIVNVYLGSAQIYGQKISFSGSGGTHFGLKDAMAKAALVTQVAGPVLMNAGTTYNFTFTPVGKNGAYAIVTEQFVPDVPPTAAFTYSPASPLAGQPVSFDASASADADGSIVSYVWNFGDGTSGSGVTTTHTFASAGDYAVNLTVKDNLGATGSTEQTLHVAAPVNQPPVAAFTVSPAVPLQNTAASFDGSASSDPDGSITAWAWDFGDGTSATGAIVSHTFAAFGTYTVKLTVTDNGGLSNFTSQSVRVGAAPIASFTISPSAPLVGATVTFDGSASSDPDGSVTAWAWTFGDGASATGATTTHVYTAAGTYAVSLTVTDDDGFTGSMTANLRVLAPPVASFTFSPASPIVNQPVSFDASASHDADGTISAYAWDFGDGTSAGGVAPSHTYAAIGPYTVTLTVTDNDGLTGTASQTLTVSPAPIPPVASFTFSPAKPLVGQMVTFDASGSTDADDAIASYAWTFGDGTSGSGVTATHAYATSGTFTITLTVTDASGLTDTVTQSVTVLAPPVAAFTYSPSSPLVGDTVTFDASASSDADGTIITYAWNFGDGTSGSGVSVTHAFASQGSYIVALTVTDNDGLAATVTHTVNVGVPAIPPTAAFSFSPAKPLVGATVSFDGSASSDPDDAIVGYAWTFGDGTSGSGVTATHAYATSGTFTITLTVTDASGLTGIASQSVQVLAPPVASFVFSPASPLVGDTVSFDASASSDADGTIIAYAWDFGDTGSGSGVTATHAYAAQGAYLVTLTVTDNDGLTATATKTVNVGVPAIPPTAAFTFSPAKPLVGATVSVDGSSSSDPDDAIVSYAWTFGDGGVGSGVSASHAYATFGTFTITLTVTDASGLSNSATQSVTVYAAPVASFAYSPSAPVAGESITFDGSASSDADGTITASAWTFGDGGVASGVTATHAYATAGTYTVTLTVTDSDGFTGTDAKSVAVGLPPQPPVALFTFSPAKPLVGTTVSFDGSASYDPDGSIASYAWTFGDGAVASVAKPTHAYAAAGPYSVTLTVTDLTSLTNSVTHAVTVYVGPTAAFTFSPAKPLVGGTVSFDASTSADPDGTITADAWTFGDGASGSGATATHVYAAFGPFTVTLTVTDSNGFTSTVSHAVQVYAPPVASFTFSPAKPLAGATVTFDGSGSTDPDDAIASYAWTFGDGASGSGAKPTHVYAAAGIYTVTLTVTDASGFSASVSHNVQAYAGPTAAFTFNPASPLVGQPAAFDASGSTDPDGTISAYAWTFGDAGTGTGATASHTYATFGTFTVSLTVTDNNGFTSSASHIVTVLAPPVASFTFAPAKPLAGAAVSFDGSGSSDPDDAIASYAWTFGDGTTGSGAKPSHAYSTFGTYVVQLTVTDASGLSASTSHSVTVYAPPTAAFTFSPAKPLQGSAVGFDASGSSDPDDVIATYAWIFGDGASGSGVTISHPYAAFGTYNVQLTVTDASGFTGTVTHSVVVYALPVASFTFSPSQPQTGATVTFDGSGSTDSTGTIATYAWTFGDGNSGSGVTATHAYAAVGSYTVQLTVTDSNGFSASTSKTVQVIAPPVAAFTFSPASPLTGQSVGFDASTSVAGSGTITSYAWTFGDGASGSGITAAHTYATAGTFSVVLTVTNSNGLTNSATQPITVRAALAPSASFTLTRTLMSVAVDGSASSDPNAGGSIVSYAWNWGDGTTGTGATASHTYAAAGLYTVTLTVTDNYGLTATTSRQASVASSTIDYSYSDFFNVPYGEWWDYRTGQYGDLPIDAECFNATSIANLVCSATNPSVADSETYPYTDWFPNPFGAASPIPGATTNNPVIYTPYRLKATGLNVQGYNLSQPVFLPTLNYAQAPGNRLDFHWDMHYLDTAEVNGLSSQGCAVQQATMDGFILRSEINLTMDAQESRRMFNVPSSVTGQAALQSWWNTNAPAPCYLTGPVENALSSWFVAMGGGTSAVGKYDVMNGYQYFYSPFYTNIVATVDADGTTHLVIDHVAWATEVLLARMFYWGNASYQTNYLDSTKARGWWGMELGWMDGANFSGTVRPGGFNFNLTTVMQYHFQQLATPGPNGVYDRTDDVPTWSWGPILNDYVNDYTPKHLLSELDRYPNPPYTYVHSTPGAPSTAYGQALPYDYVPDTWNLQAGRTWHFAFPKTDVVFYNPNTTPQGASPTLGAFVQVFKPLAFSSIQPGGFGTWDGTAYTWDVMGPAATGGKLGSPGPDGIPGTSDDQYPLAPLPLITFT